MGGYKYISCSYQKLAGGRQGEGLAAERGGA